MNTEQRIKLHIGELVCLVQQQAMQIEELTAQVAEAQKPAAKKASKKSKPRLVSAAA